MTALQIAAAETLRSMYRVIRAERRAVGEDEQERIGDLIAALSGTATGNRARVAFRALGWAGGRSELCLGDIVGGVYHGVVFVGRIYSYDGSGHLYIDFPESLGAEIERITVLGIERDGLFIHARSAERAALYLVSRPEVRPEVKAAPTAALGGCYIARAA